ncbi:MAG: hypothetical protein D6732_05315 [Methanobacteriota archaeon]|nr:MAG: hypothetical protein D6732_05315 [Euryarchaeota archaeon]
MTNLLLLSLNFSLGLLSSFSPCLFPLLPTFLTIQVSQTRKMKFFESIGMVFALILGLVAVLTLFTLITTSTLKKFLIANYVIFARIQALILLIIGILMLAEKSIGLSMSIPSKVEEMLYSGDTKSNYLFAFVLGVFYTIIAAPCAMGYFLTMWVSILTLTFIGQMLNLLAFSFGASVPFFVISFIQSSSQLVRIRQRYTTFKKIVAISLIFTGIYLFASSLF